LDPNVTTIYVKVVRDNMETWKTRGRGTGRGTDRFARVFLNAERENFPYPPVIAA
jgi:hypothetical protein